MEKTPTPGPAEPQEEEAFEGFETPTTTPVPDIVFDELLCKLSGSELKVLLYIIRRTLGFKKNSDAISLSQMQCGILTKEEKQLDHGCGIKRRDTIVAALGSLEKKGYIVSHKGKDAEGDNTTTIYHLHFKGVVTKPDYPSHQTGLPRWSPNRTTGSHQTGPTINSNREESKRERGEGEETIAPAPPPEISTNSYSPDFPSDADDPGEQTKIFRVQSQARTGGFQMPRQQVTPPKGKNTGKSNKPAKTTPVAVDLPPVPLTLAGASFFSYLEVANDVEMDQSQRDEILAANRIGQRKNVDQELVTAIVEVANEDGWRARKGRGCTAKFIDEHWNELATSAKTLLKKKKTITQTPPKEAPRDNAMEEDAYERQQAALMNRRLIMQNKGGAA